MIISIKKITLVKIHIFLKCFKKLKYYNIYNTKIINKKL